jgi:hypothetical protein
LGIHLLLIFLLWLAVAAAVLVVELVEAPAVSELLTEHPAAALLLKAL